MEDENETGDVLSPEESAYFETKGEKVPEASSKPGPEKVEPQEKVEKPDPQVPLRALTKEREEAKRLRTEFEEYRRKSEERDAVMNDRWNTLLKATEKPAEENTPPDPSVDIFAYSKWQQEQFNKLQSKVAEKEQQETQARQSHERERAIWSHWHNSVQSYSSQQADFGDAANFLAEARDKQLSALGVVDARLKDKGARDAQVNEELKGIILAAGQQNINPAEAVYQIALQYGYAPKAAADPEKAIADLAKAVDKEVTLSGTEGSAARTIKTAEDVAAMSASEFEAWLSKAGEKGFKRLMQSA